ncbi:hypothetical protein QBC35DRAFT_30171 [Podospora australis]|uniref:Uncharacterized protein n=1 Tax=Podospora australis TaxID=1536484 RepID=A0AAN6WNZ4_9PEZI|nr:hypothetical protein QBC35DRAFT_30171 [Podospora australis]
MRRFFLLLFSYRFCQLFLYFGFISWGIRLRMTIRHWGVAWSSLKLGQERDGAGTDLNHQRVQNTGYKKYDT